MKFRLHNNKFAFSIRYVNDGVFNKTIYANSYAEMVAQLPENSVIVKTVRSAI